MSFDDAVEHLKMQTRRYAKRQLTWFRKNQNINWIFMDKEEKPLDIAYNFIEEFINKLVYKKKSEKKANN